MGEWARERGANVRCGSDPGTSGGKIEPESGESGRRKRRESREEDSQSTEGKKQ